MKSGLVGLAILALAGPAGAVSYVETANPAQTTESAYGSYPQSLSVTFTVPTPVVLAYQDGLLLNIPFSVPITLNTPDLEPYYLVEPGTLIERIYTLYTSPVFGYITVTGARAYFSNDSYSLKQGVLVPVSGTFTIDFVNAPEPAAWALMLLGFGLIGSGLRASRGRYRARNYPTS